MRYIKEMMNENIKTRENWDCTGKYECYANIWSKLLLAEKTAKTKYLICGNISFHFNTQLNFQIMKIKMNYWREKALKNVLPRKIHLHDAVIWPNIIYIFNIKKKIYG